MRDEFIKKFGKDEFEKISKEDEYWNKLKDIDFPPRYIWLFNHFYRMFNLCEVDFNGNRILTPKTIIDYSDCYGVKFSTKERRLMLQMRYWALSVIAKVKDENET